MHKIFIDGGAGTTGLIIKSLLSDHPIKNQIDLIEVADPRSISQRREAFAQASLAILCLPDSAVHEALEIAGDTIKIIDTSSAHRFSSGWVYGLPELTKAQPEKIRNARLVSNPGCYATGAISILRPLVDAGIVGVNHPVTILGISGFSGGGKELISQYQHPNYSLENAFRAYALNAPHKHTQEIKIHSGMSLTPVLLPSVINVPRGMSITIPLDRSFFTASIEDVHNVFKQTYDFDGSRIKIMPLDKAKSSVNFELFRNVNSANAGLAEESVEIHVMGWQIGSEGCVIAVAQLDNLGKGAASQALQNMKLMLGL